jgi:hypothetical protein
MTPIVGFAPDLDPTTPGVLVECQNIVPDEFGMRGAPEPTSVGVAALAAECRGAINTALLTGSRKLFAGTPTELYELVSGAWVDRSRAADYTLGDDERWSFAQFGNATLAAHQSAILQRADGGAFADVTGAPNAAHVETASGFAVCFNTTTSSDEWYCSAYLDDTDWTLDVTTQCVKGRLVDAPGQILAAKRLGNDIVAYKEGAMFIGRYQGPPEVWRWTQISGDVGCVGPEAVVDTPMGHIFVGKDNIYLYDGSTPKPLATGTVRRWFFGEVSGTYLNRCKLLWDRDNHLVWMYFVSAGGTQCDRCLVYHTLKGQWGVADEIAEAVINYTTSGVTYDGGTPLVTNYETGPSIPYDSLFWLANKEVPAIFNSTHVLSVLAGVSQDSYFVTGDVGDDEGFTYCDVVRLRYSTAPTTSQAVGLAKDESGVISLSRQTSMVSDGRHDMHQTARWHRFRFDTTGDYQVTAYRPSIKRVGRR